MIALLMPVQVDNFLVFIRNLIIQPVTSIIIRSKKIILINLSNTEQVINHGDRIAQMIIAKTERAELMLVQQLNESQRGDGGFGHTGIE